MEIIKIDTEVYQDLYIVGDIHGEFETLVYNLIQKDIRDSVVIIAGDCGFGFEKPGYYDNVWNAIKGRLTKNNLLLLGIRGNHDDPEYFNGELRRDYDLLKTLPDYTILEFKDKKILCIGGAISVDRQWRIERNLEEKSYDSSKRCYWETEEPIQLSEKDLQKNYPGRVYSIVSHEAPLSFLPVFTRDSIICSEDLFADVLRSRKYLETVLWTCRPYRWYYGHHHTSISESNGVTQSRCLGIQEFIRVPLEEDYEIQDNPEKEEKTE